MRKLAIGLLLAAITACSPLPNLTGSWTTTSATWENCEKLTTATITFNLLDQDGIYTGDVFVHGAFGSSTSPFYGISSHGRVTGTVDYAASPGELDTRLSYSGGSLTGSMVDTFEQDCGDGTRDPIRFSFTLQRD